MPFHKDKIGSDNHVIHAFTYADESARNAAVVQSTDIGKVALQSDNNTYWILINTTPTWTAITADGNSGSILLFGDGGIQTSTTTRYLTPGFDNGAALTNESQIRAPRSGNIQGFYIQIRQGGAAGGAVDITYTLRVNGSDTLATVVMDVTDTTGSDTSTNVSISANDLISISVDKASGINNSPDDVYATLSFY